LGATRLSRYTDATTSPERQESAVETVSDAIGGHVVGWARDMDVSASKVSPKDRPELGDWMNRPQDYDVIAWWRLDRAVRSMADMADLGRWAKEHKKRLIFAEGPGGTRLELDMGSPMSELIMMLLAFAAQMEAEAISERVTGAREYLRSVGRWSGGRVPFGFIPVPHPTEDQGWWLGLHEDSEETPGTAPIARQMVAMVLSGKSYHQVSEWMNAAHPGITPANHRRKLAGRDIDPKARWNPGMVSTWIKNPLLNGRLQFEGSAVRNADGETVKCGDALIDDGTWRRLVKVTTKKADTGAERRSDAHPLLGVLYCGSCGGRLYQGWLAPGPNRKESVRQYRCAAKTHGRKCRKPAYVVADPVDRYTEREFLARAGSVNVVEVITTPGIDHTDEIEELKADIADLAERLTGMRGAAADAVGKQLQSRSDRLERLQAAPVIPPRHEEVPTGETYAAQWARETVEGRRDMLKAAGARVVVGETYRGARDPEKRLTFALGQPDDPDDAEAAELAALVLTV